jgi:N-6 DNA Methylase
LSERELSALKLWRAFATGLTVKGSKGLITWQDYTKGTGYVDEEKLVQPTAFPVFAQQCLGWTLQENLAPEESGKEGKPDFTPADSVTHKFVFETKSTNYGVELDGFSEQVERYLTDGMPRIRTVLLTNLVGARIFALDENGKLYEKYRVNLRSLLTGPLEEVANNSEARRLADLFDEFRRKQLTPEQKIETVRAAPEWNPVVEVTSSSWILGRIDNIVALLTRNVLGQIKDGALQDTSRTSADIRRQFLIELRQLATRLGESDADKLSLNDFVDAGDTSLRGKALEQFASHVAYYAATRLMLVRVWEDLDLLDPMLHDGGFNEQMTRFSGVIKDVVRHSFTRAMERYQSLFDQRNAYSWYVPHDNIYIDVIYDLANTYLGAIESDVLGQVYERMLARIDRKLLGVYYTPRDIISLIWDLIDFDTVAEEAESSDRNVRVLDIATGSGGFLVDAAQRLRKRVVKQIAVGAGIKMQEWINDAADGLNGVELNRFSAYLAELNLLVQFGQLLSSEPSLRLPAMGVISGDTLTLHNPVTIIDDWEHAVLPNGLLVDDEDRRERARRIKFSSLSDFTMDVACGNPPYIGEKLAAPIMARTRRNYPYWESFVGQHMDYLYWFLILGVSKLRAGGRFGFITTEYWLRAEGAKPLRRYIARTCQVDRVALFRDFRLFPDALGQHSMIITGTRAVGDDGSSDDWPEFESLRPKISIYRGGPVSGPLRSGILSAIRDAKSSANVQTFTARRSPNDLGEASWADIILTQKELSQRQKLDTGSQVALQIIKGNETTVNNVTEKTQDLLSAKDLTAVGGPGTRAGIQLLTADEVNKLGALNEAEEKVLRRVVNTRDIYPYAVVLPDDPDRIIFLAKPQDIDEHLTDEQVVGSPFPQGMPTLESHISQFRSILEVKTSSHNERRPWWTIHRPRVDSEKFKDRGTRWADYCVLSRWGAGGRLIVGRAPAATSPASGLHILRAEDDATPAAYLVALYNSSLYQDIAESLPPGQLRKADLESLGVPLRPDFEKGIVEASEALSAIVVDLVRRHTLRFPLLAESLRSNVTLTDLTEGTWSPAVGPKTKWGSLDNVKWVDGIAVHRAGTSALGEVNVAENLLGQQVEVTIKGTGRLAATITLTADVGDDVALALGAYVRSLAAAGGKVKDLRDLQVPVKHQDLSLAYTADTSSLMVTVEGYRAQRSTIDETLSAAI